MVFAYTDEPFTTLQPEALFHASRFLLNVLTSYGSSAAQGRGDNTTIGQRKPREAQHHENDVTDTVKVDQYPPRKVHPPRGISIARIVFTLAQHAEQLEAFKLARQMYERLRTLRVRAEWQHVIDITTMTLETKV